MTMTKGEKAELTIEPEWGYGKKGNIDAGYPLIKAACTETLIAKCFQYYNKKSYKTEQVWYLTPFITKLIFSRGVARGGGRGAWGAHDPPSVGLLLSKQPTIFRWRKRHDNILAVN